MIKRACRGGCGSAASAPFRFCVGGLRFQAYSSESWVLVCAVYITGLVSGFGFGTCGLGLKAHAPTNNPPTQPPTHKQKARRLT